MNFDDTSEEAVYRARVRNWLSAHAALRMPGDAPPRWDDPAERLAAARAWQAKRAEGGYACMGWPSEWGGPGATAIEQIIYQQEEAKYRIPPMRDYFEIGQGFCLPTVFRFAPHERAAAFAEPARRGAEIWCQLFSEPVAGSDLAGLRTRAVRDGEGWILNGQKVWTSGAHFADYGLILVRTDPDVPKHKGLTMFWLDLKSPGVEIRTIHQMSGSRHFNEVFFDGVRIHDAQRLGAVGDGWKVSLFTLMNERVSGGGLAGPNFAEIFALAQQLPGGRGGALMDDDAAFRARLADWFIQSEGLRLTRLRTMTALSRGEPPGPESSIGKLVAASSLLDIAHAAMEAEDAYGILCDPELAPMSAIFQYSMLHTPGLRIAGGTDEILRNIVAERVLGLPGDVRVDKDVPFRDVPGKKP